ncbi:MAG TPA: ThiF family adenylyltransferase [Planctomycetaceae bacterium]|nr:ThiF family adenylyltransferase [Planctomycetaceae bacterium]
MSAASPTDLDRYSRQVLFSGLGEEGQRKLLASRVLLCGCGALGTVLAETLVRAGVGRLRIVDRDFVETTNLQRQVLYDEDDVRERLPKAVAAERKLAKINSGVALEAIVADIDHTNILRFAEGVDLILDGTDNFEVRFLVNDAALETGLPWIYAGVIGSHGQTMAVFPGRTACLRCLIEGIPEPGTMETCDTAGVLGPAVNVIASLEAVAAMKILSGRADLVEPVLTVVDVWDLSFRKLNMADLRERSDCPACKRGEREWLSGRHGSQTTTLCGRNAVQVRPQQPTELDLDELSRRLGGAGAVSVNRFLLRLNLADPDYELTVFRDGRAIIKGTQDLGVARGLYSRYIGL